MLPCETSAYGGRWTSKINNHVKKQTIYSQRQIESAANKQGLKQGKKAISSALKSAGLDSNTSKQAAESVAVGARQGFSAPHASTQNSDSRGISVTGSVKSGLLAGGAGIKASRQFNTNSAESHTRVRDSWSKNPSASIEISAPIAEKRKI